MFNSSMIFYIYAINFFQRSRPVTTDVYLFNEDSEIIENLHGMSWDRTIVPKFDRPSVRVVIPELFSKSDKYLLPLWMTAANIAGIDPKKIEVVKPPTDGNYELMYAYKQGDVFLQSRTAGLITFQLLPFVSFDYAIYYKINDLHLSSTFFIDGLSNELWTFVFLGFFLIFIGFSVSALIYHRFFRHRTSIGFLFIYQAKFWCTQHGAETKLDRYLSWKIQKMIGFFFNCIIMTAFAAKFIELMSVRQYTQQFHSLNDFSRIRSHSICIQENLYPLDFFIEKGFNSLRNKDYYRPEWIGLLNEPVCEKVFKNYYEGICNIDNIAAVMPVHQFHQSLLNCDSFELRNMFPKSQITIPITNIYSYKEKLNVAFILMRTTGVIDRVLIDYNIKRNPKVHFKGNFNDKYEVWKHGVTFDHVKLIVIGYFSFIPFVFVIFALEKLHRIYILRC